MGHVLGFGTLWDQSPNACWRSPSSPPGTIQDTYFSCPKARAAFDSVGGTTYTGGGSSPPAGNKVPVENCGTSPFVSPVCGGGTVNGHWREVVLGNELMTGYVNGGSNPLEHRIHRRAGGHRLHRELRCGGHVHAHLHGPAARAAPRHSPWVTTSAVVPSMWWMRTGTVVRVISDR